MSLAPYTVMFLLPPWEQRRERHHAAAILNVRLTVTGVRIERLRDSKESDAVLSSARPDDAFEEF